MKQFGSIAMLAQARLDCRLGPRHYPIAICLSWLNCNFGSSQSTLSILMIAQVGTIAILVQVRAAYGVCVCVSVSVCMRVHVFDPLGASAMQRRGVVTVQQRCPIPSGRLGCLRL